MKFYHAFTYDPADGRILKRSTCSEREFSWYKPHAVITDNTGAANWDDDTHWVQAGGLVERPAMNLTVEATGIVADGVDVARITGIPAGATVRISGQPDQAIEEGVLEFSTSTTGLHRIRVEAFPYRPIEILVNAT